MLIFNFKRSHALKNAQSLFRPRKPPSIQHGSEQRRWTSTQRPVSDTESKPVSTASGEAESLRAHHSTHQLPFLLPQDTVSSQPSLTNSTDHIDRLSTSDSLHVVQEFPGSNNGTSLSEDSSGGLGRHERHEIKEEGFSTRTLTSQIAADYVDAPWMKKSWSELVECFQAVVKGRGRLDCVAERSGQGKDDWHCRLRFLSARRNETFLGQGGTCVCGSRDVIKEQSADDDPD